VIRSLALAPPERFSAPKASRQKRDAIMDIAERLALLAERARSSDLGAVAAAAAVERRKSLRAGLELIAGGGADTEGLDRVLSPWAGDSEPGAALELRVVRAGLRGLLACEHPYLLIRRLSAHLGQDYMDRAGAWIASRMKRRRYRPEPLVVPGELPDVLRSLSMDHRSLERALRSAGRDIVAAALAGCPQESMALAKPLYGKVGGTVLEDEAAWLRSRLSGDEMAQAQTAFLEIVRNLEERGELRLGEEDVPGTDPAFVAEFTRAILALDDRPLKAAFGASSGLLLATAMQGMEPRAHDRILGILPKKDERRILDAIDDVDPLPRGAILASGRELAGILLAAARKAGAATPEIERRLALLKDWKG